MTRQRICGQIHNQLSPGRGRYRGGDFLGLALVSESRTKKMLKQVQHDSGFADGRSETSPDSEQIERTGRSPKVKLCERGANPRQIQRG